MNSNASLLVIGKDQDLATAKFTESHRSEGVSCILVADSATRDMRRTTLDFPSKLAEIKEFDASAFPKEASRFAKFMRRRFSVVGVSSANAIRYVQANEDVGNTKLNLLEWALVLRIKVLEFFLPKRTPGLRNQSPNEAPKPQQNWIIPHHNEKLGTLVEQLTGSKLTFTDIIVFNPSDADLTLLCDVITYSPQLWEKDLYVVIGNSISKNALESLEYWRRAFSGFCRFRVVEPAVVTKAKSIQELKQSAR